jgi:hypothetical protein
MLYFFLLVIPDSQNLDDRKIGSQINETPGFIPWSRALSVHMYIKKIKNYIQSTEYGGFA